MYLDHIISFYSRLVIVFFFWGAFINVGASAVNSREIGDLLERTLSSLDKMLLFFGDDFASVNVDGLFGIRVGQGSVNQTLTDCEDTRFHCPQWLNEKLRDVNDKINNIAAYAAPYVENQDTKYYRNFLPLLDGPYILHYKIETINEPHILEHDGNRKYDELKGDRCLSLLIGTDEMEPKCSVTEDCWSFMTESNQHGYYITHQLLYFIIADKIGCLPAIELRLKSLGESTVRGLETKLCGHILADAKRATIDNHVAFFQQDLFLEQSLLCSILGYQNFIRPQWVRMVLAWQSDDGCFKFIPSMTTVDTEITQLQGEERRLLLLMKQEAENIDQLPSVTGRKLMREKVMKGECLAHKTGLGFGLVGSYIRYFVRSLYVPQELNP